MGGLAGHGLVVELSSEYSECFATELGRLGEKSEISVSMVVICLDSAGDAFAGDAKLSLVDARVDG